MRTLLIAIVALIAAPLVAWVSTVTICSVPGLGVLCGHNAYAPLLLFTLIAFVCIFLLLRRISRRIVSKNEKVA